MQQHGYDLQRDLNQQVPPSKHPQSSMMRTDFNETFPLLAAPSVTTENMQFLYDNGGPYLKIYVNENNMNNLSNEYDVFDRNQHELPNFANRDGLNNFLPNTQAQLSFNQMGQASVPLKNPGIQSSVIHHLVSSLGPNKTGSYSPFGDTINNNQMPVTVTNSFTNAAPIPTTTYPIRNQNLSPFNDNPIDMNVPRASVESSNPVLSSPPTSNNVTPAVNVKKTRKVAEVKPMRMSYSDVLSKNAANGQETSPTTGSTNSASSSPNTTLPVTTKSVKLDKAKFGSGSFEKKIQDGDQTKAKKSPINTNVNGVSTGVGIDIKKVPTIIGKPEKPSTIQGPAFSAKKKTSQGIGKDSSGKTSLNQSGSSKTFPHQRTSDSDDDEEDNSSMDESDDDYDDPTEYYNVRKNVYHGEHHNIEKIVTTKGSTISYKKVKSASVGSTKKTEKAQKRTTKTSSRKRQKHEVLLKLVLAWGEYLLKFIQWLWTLVYDVGFLSCGIIWDRMSWCYQCATFGLDTVRQELSGSPGKAVWLWMKNCWKTFDGKFDKKSRWAFWRWMFKKKPLASEQVKDPYKDGKLPKTAEEAMKSLLNCKGKDAYR